MIDSIDWKRLTPQASLEYCVAGGSWILLRDARGIGPELPPMLGARVRDGRGGFKTRPLRDMGFVWQPQNHPLGDGWVLRTQGEPTTMTHVSYRWGKLVKWIAERSDLDDRLVLTTIAAETGNVAPDASGQVKAPRTELGYPDRTGETDPGDFERDGQDWQASHGRHSSHGLMQTLIGTAVSVRPDLFADVDPTRHRTVLWDPAKSIACGVALLSAFPEHVRHDPIAARVVYASGSIRPAANAWGAHVYDDYVMLSFIALWNDLAHLVSSDQPEPPRPDDKRAAWITLGLTCFAVSLISGLYALRYARPAHAGAPS